MNVRTLEGARWSCSACGRCCRLSQLGPVEPEIAKNLHQRGIERDWPPAAEAPWLTLEAGPQGAPVGMLRKVDGHCVFLREDNRCAIHALYGEAAKPGFCREYPYRAARDADGIALVVRDDCGGLHARFEDGAALPDRLVEGDGVVPRTWAPPLVRVLPDHGVSAAVWAGWEREILAELASEAADPPGPEARISALRGQLYARCGQEPEEADPMRYLVALRAALEGVFQTLTAATASFPPQVSAWERAFLLENLDNLRRSRERMATDWSALDVELAPDARRYLDLTLRGRVLSKQLHAAGGVAEGLGLWLLETAIARAGVPEGREPPLGAADLGPAFSAWRKLSMNTMIQRVLQLARPALVDAFLHAEP